MTKLVIKLTKLAPFLNFFHWEDIENKSHYMEILFEKEQTIYI